MKRLEEEQKKINDMMLEMNPRCTAALDIADRQNAHRMTLAVRAIVELFRIVKREDEVSRQILALQVKNGPPTKRLVTIVAKAGKDPLFPGLERGWTPAEGVLDRQRADIRL
ncbi:hypothetical protein N0V85_004437 [Neurospora sp. IMI 360204]|nr:hypothetical protein N0V85_004437 [Neurospora sp. IMI 360204]